MLRGEAAERASNTRAGLLAAANEPAELRVCLHLPSGASCLQQPQLLQDCWMPYPLMHASCTLEVIYHLKQVVLTALISAWKAALLSAMLARRPWCYVYVVGTVSHHRLQYISASKSVYDSGLLSRDFGPALDNSICA